MRVREMCISRVKSIWQEARVETQAEDPSKICGVYSEAHYYVILVWDEGQTAATGVFERALLHGYYVVMYVVPFCTAFI
jgi:hypothetical protein